MEIKDEDWRKLVSDIRTIKENTRDSCDRGWHMTIIAVLLIIMLQGC